MVDIRRVFGGSSLLLALIASVLAIGGGAALAQTTGEANFCELGRDGVLSWSDRGASRGEYHVRVRDGAGGSSFERTVVGFSTQVDEPDAQYELRWRANGSSIGTICDLSLIHI